MPSHHVPSYYEETAEESIFNLVPEKQVPPAKPPMYRSADAPKPLGSFGASTGKHAEFGKPIGSYKNNPANFVKCLSGSTKVDALKKVKKESPDQLKYTRRKASGFQNKDPVPNANDKPIMGLVTNKNFIVSNAVEVILAQPRKTNEDGPHFMQGENYGKVPPYLGKIRDQISSEYEAIREIMQSQKQAEATTREMTDEEKAAMLNALKAKWESLNHEYQQQAHLVTLSPGEKAKKEGLEAGLAQIEKQIEKFSASGPIYVALDQ